MINKIEDLLRQDPLPADAEQQLDALISALPSDQRAAAWATYGEALATALNSEGYVGGPFVPLGQG
jgi:hypothetical protein